MTFKLLEAGISLPSIRYIKHTTNAWIGGLSEPIHVYAPIGLKSEAKVKSLVLNHFVPPDDKLLTDETWIDAVHTTFSGNIIVGKGQLQLEL